MYDKKYYEDRKLELQQEFQKVINEAYEDIERAVIRKISKQRELEVKLKMLTDKEQESIEKTKQKADKKL